ncbi:5-deoxy-glucuronate isomerase [Pseudonocardia sp. TRM90224]|uniref:5-deoxy-glucuronate isomerase n=1 Tax=Pseudonocardia sp. TRM90224 TaxID=2812678 RepID=UPI001E382672|nr:5-deoxy-glucuronate isomerase [Pseudonocardia sp. TRM90224]
MSKHVVRKGETADGPFSLVVTPESAGWGYSSLRLLELPAGGSATFATGEDETVVLPLAGACTVECASAGDRERFELAGRSSVFTRVTDFAYVPRDAEVTVSSVDGGRFALPAARATRRLAPRYGPAEGVQVELRGAGQSSRQVNNFCTPQTFEAEKLIAVEVLTPSSNWSSYPPHKHDEQREGEAELEEVYYFEVENGGPGFQRVYTSGEGKEIDVCTEVRSGDTVLIPHGWHGPSMATPGYHLYYLNVMAGPSPDRAWLICDDPEHAWVRGTWDDQEIDPRLPLTTTEEK